MSYLRYAAAMASLTLGIFVGCTPAESTPPEEEEAVGVSLQPLGETTCTTASPSTTKVVGSSAGSYNQTGAAGYNPTSCPYQFLVEFSPQGGGSFGAGAFYDGYANTPQSLTNKTTCEAYNQYYEAWELISGTWTVKGSVWLKGLYTSGDVRNCYWSTYSSSGPDFDANPAVTSTATKVRIAVSRWSEVGGTKGADSMDTYHSAYAGIGR